MLQEAIPRHADIADIGARDIDARPKGSQVKFQGSLRKDGRFWLADVPVFDAMTQGRTRKEALAMIADWFATVIDREGFAITVEPVRGGGFEIGSSDARAMIGLLLRRQRERSGLSMAQVARQRLRSEGAYARYERGLAVPTVDKLDELLRVVARGRAFVLRQSAA